MKSYQVVASTLSFAVLAAVAQSALAEGDSYQYPQPIVSPNSRAQVRADAIAAARADQIEHGEATYVLTSKRSGSSLSRAEVRAEAIEARRLGLMAHGEAPAREPTAAELMAVQQAGLNALSFKISRQ